MKKLMNLLPLFALLLGVTAALATAIVDENAAKKEAFIDGQWQEIPLTYEDGMDYICKDESQFCVRELDADGHVISVTEGEFVELPH